VPAQQDVGVHRPCQPRERICIACWHYLVTMQHADPQRWVV
jgi:hypothetical protein